VAVPARGRALRKEIGFKGSFTAGRWLTDAAE